MLQPLRVRHCFWSPNPATMHGMGSLLSGKHDCFPIGDDGPDNGGSGFGDSMHHDWIFDVLRDLRAYAASNGLPGLAAKAEEALRVAEAELALRRTAAGGVPPGGLPH